MAIAAVHGIDMPTGPTSMEGPTMKKTPTQSTRKPARNLAPIMRILKSMPQNDFNMLMVALHDSAMRDIPARIGCLLATEVAEQMPRETLVAMGVMNESAFALAVPRAGRGDY